MPKQPKKTALKNASIPASKPARPHHEPAVPSPDAAFAGQATPVADAAVDIRGVLIQIAGSRLLLPNATIAEVLSYAPPEPVGEEAPEWLLGRIRWRGWQVPLIAFSQLAGIGREQAGLGSKVIVLKALGGNTKAPYFAMLTQGFPRLVTVARASLIVLDAGGIDLPAGIEARVLLSEDEAFIPDLGAIESLLSDSLAQVA